MSLTPEQRAKRNERMARRREQNLHIISTEDLISIQSKLDRIEKYMKILATFTCTDHGVDIDDVARMD